MKQNLWQRSLGRLLGRWMPPRPEEELDWATDAEWAQREQEPLRARALVRWVALILVALVVWAAYAQIDEVTRGEGRVVPSSQLQVIQSVDGGVVSEILVREGQTVEAGDILLRIDPTRFVSSLRENRAQLLPLRVKAERLQALSENRPFSPSQELRADAPELVAREQVLYDSSHAEREAQLAIANQQLAQRTQELYEAQSRLEQAKRAYELATKELSVTQPLMESGAVSEVDLLRLEREVARTRGDRDQTEVQIKRVQSSIQEAKRKLQEVELTYNNQVRNELSDVMAKLNSLSEGSLALADRVKHAEVRSPMRGAVKRLLINTLGGVVQPGQEVIEIVPLDDRLVLETRIKPKDIAFLRPGQPAFVKFTAYDFAIYGGLDAVVDHIGADTVADDKGNAFYIVRVHTDQPRFGDNLPIIPGMVAEVDILTGKKTVLNYLLKPVLRAKANALTER